MKLYPFIFFLLLGIFYGCRKSLPIINTGNNTDTSKTTLPPSSGGSGGGCSLSSSCNQYWVCLELPSPVSIFYGNTRTFFQSYGASVSSLNKAYFAGGHDEFWKYGGSLDDGIEYDPVNCSTRYFKLSVPRTFLAGAIAGNKILFAGGRQISGYSNNPFYNTVDIFDEKTLVRTTSFLSEPRAHLAAVSTDTKAYFIGGKTSNGFSNKMDIYNSLSNTWNVISMPRERGFAGAAIIDNKIYIAGGQDKSGNIFSVDIYDIQSGQWTSINAPNDHPFASVVAINNKLLIAGGDGKSKSSIDIYNTNTNKCTTYTLSSSRFNITVAKSQNKILLLGGNHYYNGMIFSEESEYIDVYDDSTENWITGRVSPGVGGVMSASVGSKIITTGYMYNDNTTIANTLAILNLH